MLFRPPRRLRRLAPNAPLALAAATVLSLGALAACGSSPATPDATDASTPPDGDGTLPDSSPPPSAEASVTPDASEDASDAGPSDAAPSDGGPDATVDAGPNDAGPLPDAAETSTPDSSPPIDAPTPFCGDGLRDPSSEECDNGAANADTPTAACSTKCLVEDFLAASSPTSLDAGVLQPFEYPPHRMGLGRHAIASTATGFAVTFLEQESTGDYILRAEAFTPTGARVASFPIIGAPSPAIASADPVLAPLSTTQYAAVWQDEGTNPAGPSIAMALLDTSSASIGAIVYANASTEGPEGAPDAVFAGGQLVVAWEDDSGPSPDLKLATFDSSLHAVGGETSLASTSATETAVSLAPFNDTWAAAWRASESGLETIHVRSGAVEVTTNPQGLGPTGERPALVQIGPTTLFVAFSVQTNLDDSGAGDTTTILQGAVIDLSATAPSTVTATELHLHAQADGGDQRFPEAFPALAVNGTNVWLTAWTGGQPGDPLEDETWLTSGPLTTPATLGTTVLPLPRWELHRGGEQTTTGLVATGTTANGSLVAVWEDDGWTFGEGIAAPEDIVLQVIPAPVARLSVTGGSN